MKAPLLRNHSHREDEEEEEEKIISERDLALEKLKEVIPMAAPMVPVALSQYLLRFVSMVIVGHLGQLALAGVTLATSLANVTGFSLIYGLVGGLETLCGQAYGAKQYHKLGHYTCSAIMSLFIFSVPVSVLWIFLDKILILLNQDSQVSEVACQYSIWLIPPLFGFAVYQSLVRYFQSQRLIFPLLLSSSVALAIHVPLCWFLVYRLGIGIIGAALSVGFSYWLNGVFLWGFMKFSSSCEKTRIIVNKEAFSTNKEFLGFALPSAMMSCLEIWATETLVLISGFLPNSKLETSILSIYLTTKLLHFYVVYGLAASASTKVANELGAGRPRAARATSYVAVAVAVLESTITSSVLFMCRTVWGYIFSNEREVVEYATRITPLVCSIIFIDSILAVLCGIARGTGWQRLGAYINIGAYYFAGLPVGILLSFGLRLGGIGCLVGDLIGCTIQTLALSLMLCLTNWDKEAIKARERVFARSLKGDPL